MKYFNNPDRLVSLLWQLWQGLGVTMSLFGFTLLFSLPLGLALALLRMSRHKALRLPVQLFILVMRGTPLILQVFTVYFVLPMIFGAAFERLTAVVIAFVMNYAAYFAEIYRGGVQAVPVGQREAAHVLGFTRSQAFMRIILPQVIKRIVLPVSNEVITLVKDTALVTAVGMVELYRVARNAASTVGSLEPLFIAGAVYLLINAVVSFLFNRVNRYFSYYQG
ncbi:MAG: amino acid ABC transporter permease [Eubacteriales bacterium]|jgi:polar amino acid transport system permease protein|nr:amino acid ABC transporter permease [Eubacteriales bacterium]MDD4134244.1 amino acid ABC transporter permease [Eubacteriales bacterium]